MKNNVPVHPFRDSKQGSARRPNIVKNVTSQLQLGKAVLRVEQDTKLTCIVLSRLMDQGWAWAYCAGSKLSLSVRLRHLDSNLS